MAEKGFQCRHAGDIGLSEANDIDIVREAKNNKEIIVTHDLDYGHLLAFQVIRAPQSLFSVFETVIPRICFLVS
jgi:predicted nuclease of predicted toxin-antitoxin system